MVGVLLSFTPKSDSVFILESKFSNIKLQQSNGETSHPYAILFKYEEPACLFYFKRYQFANKVDKGKEGKEGNSHIPENVYPAYLLFIFYKGH